MRLLLAREDVDCNACDRGGQAAITWATRHRQYNMVEILLGMERIKPDMVDQYGLTPLEWACRVNSKEVVEMLLERNDVNLICREIPI